MAAGRRKTPHEAARGASRTRDRSGRTAVDGAARPSRAPARRPAERSRSHLTSRAAILAVVVCAITLSLAYPVREYIAQRRQISALETQRTEVAERVTELEKRKKRLRDPEYIKREARRRLHFCWPGEKCYVVLHDQKDGSDGEQSGPADRDPWFTTLWKSVTAADHADR